MAYCYMQLKEWENVILYCDKVLEIKKDDFKAIYRRCRAYLSIGVREVENKLLNL